MNEKSDKKSTGKSTVDKNQSTLAKWAWAAVLIISVPRIIYRLIVTPAVGELATPIWLGWILTGCMALLWLLTWILPNIKPLRGFFLALAAFCFGWFLVLPTIEASAVWSGWIEQAPWGTAQVIMLGTRLVIVALMTLTLIGSGIGMRELYLVRGNPRAPGQPARLLLGILDKPKPWNQVVREWLPYYVIIIFAIVIIQVRPNISQIMQVFRYLPAITIAGAINAFTEEFGFRSMILARTEHVVGARQAIFLCAGLFGLMHYWGAPRGPFGVLLAAYLGWIAAKSMVETKGFVWAFLIHFIGDFLLYASWAMMI